MACGRATVVAESGGAAELFTPGHDAVGVPPGQAVALASALRELVNDPPRCERLGACGRRTALERFSRARLGPQLLAAYQSFGLTVPDPIPEGIS
jgi:glycosyltransferase involved in cell wall biosynthesis